MDNESTLTVTHLSPIDKQKFNFIPVSYEFISHVRRLDGFDVSNKFYLNLIDF